MDASAVNVNVTVDDFDSVLSYPDQAAWQTPDPSSPTFDASTTPWWMGTYHKTDVIDASVSFNFIGPALFIYGSSGPAYGSYEVQIDSVASTFSAYAANNVSGSFLLFGASNLTYAPHTLTLRNLGAKNGDAGGNALLFDYLRTTVQLAPAGYVLMLRFVSLGVLTVEQSYGIKHDLRRGRPGPHVFRNLELQQIS
ncbi:hypothetical protein DXG03_000536 [Asterophora parasitica]|uniref:Uncharacterized protein n=1 Tax=Asterophora parasitica TaxID=117018 RepID=A0A9P7G5T8_9AGAR|nr:hypothetical protein DXG03_000536 [Asterophora parasitica]